MRNERELTSAKLARTPGFVQITSTPTVLQHSGEEGVELVYGPSCSSIPASTIAPPLRYHHATSHPQIRLQSSQERAHRKPLHTHYTLSIWYQIKAEARLLLSDTCSTGSSYTHLNTGNKRQAQTNPQIETDAQKARSGSRSRLRRCRRTLRPKTPTDQENKTKSLCSFRTHYPSKSQRPPPKTPQRRRLRQRSRGPRVRPYFI